MKNYSLIMFLPTHSPCQAISYSATSKKKEKLKHRRWRQEAKNRWGIKTEVAADLWKVWSLTLGLIGHLRLSCGKESNRLRGWLRMGTRKFWNLVCDSTAVRIFTLYAEDQCSFPAPPPKNSPLSPEISPEIGGSSEHQRIWPTNK